MFQYRFNNGPVLSTEDYQGFLWGLQAGMQELYVLFYPKHEELGTKHIGTIYLNQEAERELTEFIFDQQTIKSGGMVMSENYDKPGLIGTTITIPGGYSAAVEKL